MKKLVNEFKKNFANALETAILIWILILAADAALHLWRLTSERLARKQADKATKKIAPVESASVEDVIYRVANEKEA